MWSGLFDGHSSIHISTYAHASIFPLGAWRRWVPDPTFCSRLRMDFWSRPKNIKRRPLKKDVLKFKTDIRIHKNSACLAHVQIRHHARFHLLSVDARPVSSSHHGACPHYAFKYTRLRLPHKNLVIRHWQKHLLPTCRFSSGSMWPHTHTRTDAEANLALLRACGRPGRHREGTNGSCCVLVLSTKSGMGPNNAWWDHSIPQTKTQNALLGTKQLKYCAMLALCIFAMVALAAGASAGPVALRQRNE